MIKEVSIFPLSSQADAEKAIVQANENAAKVRTTESDSDTSGDESDGYSSLEEREDQDETPSEVKKSSHSNSRSSIAEDVIGRKGQYGRFATQWFSRAGWSQERKRTLGMSSEEVDHLENSAHSDETEEGKVRTSEETIARPQSEVQTTTSTFDLMPKLLKTTKALFNSKSFFFSYDINITRRLGANSTLWSKPPTRETVDPLFFWNRHLVSSFLDAGYHGFYIPVMQGFVGQRAFIAQHDKKDVGQTTAVESLEKLLQAEGKPRDANEKQSKDPDSSPQPFLLTIISRRSVKRSGLRYLRRGIDDEGNTANGVETEQILSSPTWEESSPVRSFVQIRGSIPLYFSQSPYAFKPTPQLHQSEEANQATFQRHFEDLRQQYGNIQIVSLVDKRGTEARIGQEFEIYTKQHNEQHPDHALDFEWFDFHAECRGMKFENVKYLIEKMRKTLDSHGETIIKDKAAIRRQSGVIRANCMDVSDSYTRPSIESTSVQCARYPKWQPDIGRAFPHSCTCTSQHKFH